MSERLAGAFQVADFYLTSGENYLRNARALATDYPDAAISICRSGLILVTRAATLLRSADLQETQLWADGADLTRDLSELVKRLSDGSGGGPTTGARARGSHGE